MRTLFFLLLLANLTLFGFTRLDTVGAGESARLAQQVQPEKIRLLTSQQVAALGPEKTASLADVCVEWGPFADAERTRALADLEPLALGRLVSQRRVDVPSSYWVYAGSFTTRANAERRVTELKGTGITDVSVVDTGAQRFTISFGVFRTEEAAATHAANLAQKGVADARAAPRQQALLLTTLVVRDPPAPAMARLRELQAGYQGSDLKVGSCASQ
jgi:hypothetical protein